MKKIPDRIFKNVLGEIVDFKFDDKVANVFEDMLQRSVPGYSAIISTIGMLTASNSKADSNYYDLGTSLGASALAMRHNIKQPNCKIIAVDNSQPMIDRAKELVKNDYSDIPINFICDNVMNLKIENAQLVILNFTLQFILPENRNRLIQNIYNGLNPGGILILSEKITFEDKETDLRQIERYYDYKRLNGYSDLEISQKREALENVLVPETIEAHKARLKKSGFKTTDIWFQTFNFISIIAEK